MQTLYVKKLQETAIIPQLATPHSAGYDLHACIDTPVTIEPHQTLLVGTGLAIKLPSQTAGILYARSGLASKHGIIPANCVGVVDADYRGEIKIALHNLLEIPYTVSPNERIAQLVVTPIVTPMIEQILDLDDTLRGAGGFGSTGK